MNRLDPIRRGRTAAIVLLAIVVGLIVCAFQEAPYPATLCEALEMMGTSAVASAATGVLVFILLEYWPAWDGLAPKWKRPIVFGFCLVVPVLSLLARVALCAAILNQDTIYLALAAGVWAFGGSQFAHIYKLPDEYE